MPWIPALQRGDLSVCAGWNCPVLCFQSENAVLKPDIFQESCNCRDFSSKAVKSQHSLCSRASVGQWPESQLLSYNVKWLNAIAALMIKSSSFISFHPYSVFLGTCLDGQGPGSPFRAAGAVSWQCHGAPERGEQEGFPECGAPCPSLCSCLAELCRGTMRGLLPAHRAALYCIQVSAAAKFLLCLKVTLGIQPRARCCYLCLCRDSLLPWEKLVAAGLCILQSDRNFAHSCCAHLWYQDDDALC